MLLSSATAGLLRSGPIRHCEGIDIPAIVAYNEYSNDGEMTAHAIATVKWEVFRPGAGLTPNGCVRRGAGGRYCYYPLLWGTPCFRYSALCFRYRYCIPRNWRDCASRSRRGGRGWRGEVPQHCPFGQAPDYLLG
jgi:hypothetical protein